MYLHHFQYSLFSDVYNWLLIIEWSTNTQKKCHIFMLLLHSLFPNFPTTITRNQTRIDAFRLIFFLFFINNGNQSFSKNEKWNSYWCLFIFRLIRSALKIYHWRLQWLSRHFYSITLEGKCNLLKIWIHKISFYTWKVCCRVRGERIS